MIIIIIIAYYPHYNHLSYNGNYDWDYNGDNGKTLSVLIVGDEILKIIMVRNVG
jgi:hypothetical protein